jgi:hypothetical protein
MVGSRSSRHARRPPIHVRTTVAVLAAAQLVAACSPSLKTASLPGEDQARAATGKIAVLVKDVIPYAYDTGKPSACAIVFDVFNNTTGHLDAATMSIASYQFPIAELPPHTEYSDDQTITVAPVAGSCAGVVEALTRNLDSISSSNCSMENVAPADCQSMVTAVVAIDQGAVGEIRQAEASAAQQYAAQLAAAFAQAKAQAWAKRGQYQVGVGGGFVEANPAAPVLLAAVIGPNFDPLKANAATAAETTDLSFCAPNPNDATDKTPGRLAVLAATRDPYGLADWYQLRLVCSGHPDHVIWMKAAPVERMLAAGQITKQARLEVAATPAPKPANPDKGQAAAAESKAATKPGPASAAVSGLSPTPPTP